MKILKLLLAACCGLSLANATAADNPKALPEQEVVCGNARFTVLTPEMIRIEYSDKGAFEDKATFTIVNRLLDKAPFTQREDGDFLYITTPKVALKYRKGSNPLTSPASGDNLTITLKDGTVWYPGLQDTKNLMGTARTLDGANGDSKRKEMEQGLISRSGWAVIDDSWAAERKDGGRSYAMEENDVVGYPWWTERADRDALDLYFLGYGKNYKKAISDYTKVAGKIPLPPAYVFGYWYSKYAIYSADDFRNIMSEIKSNNIPADVMILDMDWHWNLGNGRSEGKDNGHGGWTGWSWNTNLIPDPKGLLDDMHRQGFKTALNLHPADGVNSNESPEFFAAMKKDLGGKYLNKAGNNIDWSIDYPDFTKAFFTKLINKHEQTGVDFWWLDWQQHLTSDYTEALSETFWCNHVFFNEMKRNRTDRRPVIFHRWGGLGSHRYQIGFSGDAFINYPTLAFQPYFTATASNVCYGYWGHDLGGHMLDRNAQDDQKLANDPELVLRWLQFGVFTPIFRTHATLDPRIERQIWKFPNFPQMLKTVRLRYTLFPYIYTMARQAYDTGISICRPLYYEYPDTEEAYKYEGEYFFGDDILVAPITEASVGGISTKEIWFPKGNWWSVSTNELVKGPGLHTLAFTTSQIPYFVRQGAILPLNPESVMSVMERPDNLDLMAIGGANGEFTLYEDSGDSNDYATSYATTKLEQKYAGLTGSTTIIINPRQGSYEGMPATRSYTLYLYNVNAPNSIKINGELADFFVYDSLRKCLSVEIPATPCTQRITLDIN